MHPGARFGDEAPQEQRAEDRAGERRARHVVEVRDLARQLVVVRAPQRHAPHRIDLLCGDIARSSSRQRIVGAEQRWQLRTERDARSARQRRECRSADRASLHRRAPARRTESRDPRHRCCRSRPSAPCACRARRRAGRRWRRSRSRPIGSIRRRRTGSFASMTSCASASATAAPPMSFFISSIDAPGLMSSPPVSKHTPLPTRRDLGMRRIAPFDIDQARRHGSGTTDGVNGGETFLEQVVADDHAMSRAVAARDFDGGLRQCLRRHVVRRRVDQIARERSRRAQSLDFRGVDASGGNRSVHGSLRIRASIALELVLPVCPAERELRRDAGPAALRPDDSRHPASDRESRRRPSSSIPRADCAGRDPTITAAGRPSARAAAAACRARL